MGSASGNGGCTSGPGGSGGSSKLGVREMIQRAVTAARSASSSLAGLDVEEDAPNEEEDAPNGRRGGLMVSGVVSGSSSPGSSPGRGHCVVFLGKTLNSHCAPLHPDV